MRKKWMVALMAALVLAGYRAFAEVNEGEAILNLKSTDLIIREAARMQLEKSGSKRAIEALGAAYAATTDNNWKLALINGLGAIKKPEIVQYLLPVPEDATLADATVKALSGLVTEGTTKAIIDYFNKANTLAAGMAMIDEAEAMLANVPNAPAAKKIFETVYKTSKLQPVRTAAMMHLVLDECKATDENAAFLAELSKPENEYGLNAVLAKWLEVGCKCGKLHLKPSGSFESEKGVQMHAKGCLYHYFAENYEKYSKKTQALIIANLAKSDNPEFVGLVRKAVESDDEVIRANALEALGELGDISDLQTIIVESQNPKSELVRNTARRLMRHVNWPGTDAFTAMAMKSYAEYKALCINVLKDRRCRAYNIQIFNEIGVERDDVAKYAIEALKHLAVDDDASRMVGYLKKGDQYFGRMADAVKNAMLHSENPDKWSDELVKIVNDIPQENLQTVLSLIADLHTAKGFDAVAAIAKDGSNEARQKVAVETLNQWPGAGQTAAILDYMKTVDNPFDRARLLSGVIKANGGDAKATATEKVDNLLKLFPICERDMERGLIFEQIASINDLYAFHKLEGMVSDEPFGVMAAAALAKNAVLYGKPEFAIVTKSLENLIVKTKGEAKEDLKAAMAKVCEPYGYITMWRYSNVYTAKDEKGEDACPAAHKTVFEPEKPGYDYDKWPKFVPAKDSQSPEVVTLHKCLGGVQRTAYIVAYIHADADKEAILEMGSDDMLKAWMNGELIVDSPKYQALVRASYKIPVKLKKGKNTLLMKVSQGSHNWEACAALKNADGGLLEGWQDNF
ncbi:MAG: HEAT repeat domain-containing protein [Victivallales bacterium]|nr:HEAT repeat domain-containing protein [Victivallales bacterium]